MLYLIGTGACSLLIVVCLRTGLTKLKLTNLGLCYLFTLHLNVIINWAESDDDTMKFKLALYGKGHAFYHCM